MMRERGGIAGYLEGQEDDFRNPPDFPRPLEALDCTGAFLAARKQRSIADAVRQSVHNEIPMHALHCIGDRVSERVGGREREGVSVHHPGIHFATTEAAASAAAAAASAMSNG